jgi:hypothetical protein
MRMKWMRLEVLRAVDAKSAIVWDVMSRSVKFQKSTVFILYQQVTHDIISEVNSHT